MCKSMETSLATYAVSLVCVCVCLKLEAVSKAVRFACMFILTFATMQLLDAGLWWSIRNRDKPLNHAISRYAIPALFAVELLVTYFGANLMFGWRNAYYELGLAAFVVFTLGAWMFRFCPSGAASYTAPDSTDGYLHWCGVELNTLTRVTFLFFLISPILFGLPQSATAIKYMLVAPLLLTFIFNFNKITFGSRWCWSSNITSVILLAYVIYARYFKP